MNSNLIEFWKQLDQDTFPRIHREDFAILKNHPDLLSTFKTWSSFVKEHDWTQDQERRKLQTSLVPVPYVGNLENAKIYVLMLNPGFLPICHWAESHNTTLTDGLWQNLYQTTDEFLFLNPDFAWHPGFTYWSSRFQKTLQQIMLKKSCSYQEALRFLSCSVANVQMVPYASNNFALSSQITNALPSVVQVKKFVRDVLLPNAEAENKIIIVARQNKSWALPSHPAILDVKGPLVRSARFEGNTEILERIWQGLGVG